LPAHLTGRRHREARGITGNLPPVSHIASTARCDFRLGRQRDASAPADTTVAERRATPGASMAYSEPWRADSAGVFAAETDEFRLIVRPSDKIGGNMRFLVVRRGRKSVPDTLIGSGVTDTKQAAMAEAEQMAERCARPGHVRTAPPA
jgi:hypothetical protein